MRENTVKKSSKDIETKKTPLKMKDNAVSERHVAAPTDFIGKVNKRKKCQARPSI